MKKTPRIISYINRKKRYFVLAKETLDTLTITRNSSFFGKILGGAVLLNNVAEIFYPSQEPWSYFRSIGFKTDYTSIDGFICDLLFNSDVKSI